MREQGLGGTLVWAVNYGYLPDRQANPPMQAVKQSFLHARAAGYRVYRDGVAIATVAAADSFTDTTAPRRRHHPHQQRPAPAGAVLVRQRHRRA